MIAPASTTSVMAHAFDIGQTRSGGAGDETRTRDFNLGKKTRRSIFETCLQTGYVRLISVFSSELAVRLVWTATSE